MFSLAGSNYEYTSQKSKSRPYTVGIYYILYTFYLASVYTSIQYTLPEATQK